MRRKTILVALAAVVLVAGIITGCSHGKCAKPSKGRSERVKLFESANSYANIYMDYTHEDLETLKLFDIVAVEPYSVPNRRFLEELKEAGTLVLAYVSVGEADGDRRYWRGWKPSEMNPDNPEIPRTTLTGKEPFLMGEDPGWPGCYFVDARSRKWREIMIAEEIPYILWLGGGNFDGLMMDVMDVVDVYEGETWASEMREGMIDLIKGIREKFPDMLLVPNRGFGILEEIAAYIDAFKFEEMTGAYGNVEGEPHYGEYYLKVDARGARENQEEIELLLEVLEEHPMPVLVLDHVRTHPPDEYSARRCHDEAERLGGESGQKFVWYGNSVEQDLYLWPFLGLSGNEGRARTDGAVEIYRPRLPESAQNPAFSPNGNTIVFTLFHSGYNRGPAVCTRCPSRAETPQSSFTNLTTTA